MQTSVTYQFGSGKKVDDSVYLDVVNQEINFFFNKFKTNHSIYRQAYWFVFGSSVTDLDKRYANLKKRYALEINNLGSVINNISTQISEYPPSVTVTTEDFQSNEITELMSQHFKYITKKANQANVLSNALEQCLFGYTFIKVNVDYKSKMSLDREASLENVEDVCSVGFDLLAKDPNKGRYMFEITQVPVFELKNRYPDKASLIEQNKYSSDYNSYLWSQRQSDTTINSEQVPCVVFYERITERMKRIQLSNGDLLWEDEYEATLKQVEELGALSYFPDVVRVAVRDRVRLMESVMLSNLILDKRECSFESFPIIYLDGNSKQLAKDEIPIKRYRLDLIDEYQRQYVSQGVNRDIWSNPTFVKQIQPYVKTAMDPQRLVNAVIQEFYNELDGRPAQGYTYPVDGDNISLLKKLKNAEIPQLMPYKTYDELGRKVDPPTPTLRAPVDGSLAQSLPVAKSLLSESIGDFSQEVAKDLPKQVSGAAVRELLTLDKAQAKPYINNFIKGLNDVFLHLADISQHVLKDERGLTVTNEFDENSRVSINGDQEQSMKSDAVFSVNVFVDINEEIHNRMDFEAAMQLAQINPDFNQFIASDGFPLMLKLSNMRDSELWTKRYSQFLEKKAQEPKQPSPVDIAMEKLQIDKEDKRLTHEEKQAELQIKAFEAGAEVATDFSKIDQERRKQLIRVAEVQAEQDRTREELLIKRLGEGSSRDKK